MTGTVELDQDGANLILRFQYREDLVALVKELPGRRWDPRNKIWRIPAAETEKVYATFSRHLFEFAPEVMSLLAGTLGTQAASSINTKAGRPTTARQASLPLVGDPAFFPTGNPAGNPRLAEATDAVTISQLTAGVRDGLRRQFPEAFWVIGEIADFDKGAGRQHRFFQLIEKAKDQPRALASVEAALFSGTAEWLLPRLAAGPDPLTLRDGIEVRVLVRVDLYAATGRFQVVVQDIDPSFTLGKLALTREQILRELQKLGIAERNRALPLPVPVLRIGVLASPDSDGWNDFLRHLEDSPIGFAVTLVAIKVQGVELKPSLLRGLAWFAQNQADVDVLCVLRGGGSRTDLAWFDDRDVALAVARHPLKVLVGIGHQRDQSVLDAIAHSEKTPTAVAALLIDCALAARRDIEERADRLQDAVHDHLDLLDRGLVTIARSLQRAAVRHLERTRQLLAGLARDVRAATQLRLARARGELSAAVARAANGAERRLERTRFRLEEKAMRHRLLDPTRVLTRGYALARSADGRILTSAERIKIDDTLIIQFRDGRVRSRVEGMENESS